MKRFLCIHIFLSIVIGVCSAQDNRPLIEVTSAVDTARITIGDRVTYTITIDYVDTMRIEKPGEGVNLGQFEIKDYRIYDPVRQEGRILQKYEYMISVFDTGTFVIPPFPVAYFPEDSLGEYKLISASAVTIIVESVIQDEERQLRDIKAPIDIPYNYVLLISVIAALLLLVALVYIGYRLYKKRKETGYLLKPPEPPRPAHEIALNALKELLNRDLISAGEIKLFYIEISEILRFYIEGRFYIHALEETSSEILEDLDRQELSEKSILNVKQGLELSDLVKFAKYKPSEKENDHIVSWVHEFIEETKVVYEVETDSEDESNPVEENITADTNEIQS